jgi:hypothetical protein
MRRVAAEATRLDALINDLPLTRRNQPHRRSNNARTGRSVCVTNDSVELSRAPRTGLLNAPG